MHTSSIVIAALCLAACGPADPQECLLAVNTECSVAYAPTYSNIFQNTLRGTCGGPGTSCHGSSGRMAGLVFSSQQESYDLLLGNTDGRVRVVAGDPDASLLMQRLECSSPSPRMPLNSDPLAANVRCAIAQWIKNGAQP